MTKQDIVSKSPRKKSSKESKRFQCPYCNFHRTTVGRETQATEAWGKGAFIYDVRYFSGIFDLPTYPHQILYYISLFSKIRWSLTYLSTQKSDVIYECSLKWIYYMNECCRFEINFCAQLVRLVTTIVIK